MQVNLPDWEFWRNMPEVQLWQACALSLDLEPESFKFSEHAWLAGPGDHGPFVEPECFRDAAEEKQFHKRLKLLIANLSRSEHFSAGTLNMAHRHLHGVKLGEFAAWANSIGWSLPAGFPMAAVVQAVDESSSEGNASARAKLDRSGAHARARFVIEARPAGVPPELLALPVDEVVAFEHWKAQTNGPRVRSKCSSYLVGQLKADIQNRIDRQREGWFTAAEAAHIVARERPGSDEYDVERRILAAVTDEDLHAHQAESRLRLGKDSAGRAEQVRPAIDLLKATELDAWLRVSAGYGFPAATSDRPVATNEPTPDRGRPVKPPQVFPAQEAEILKVIRALGHEPKQLPPRTAGKPWVKSDVWGKIGVCQLFTTVRVFDKAWARLRNSTEIAERAGL